MKTITILPEEELLSIIDKVVTADVAELRLVVPSGARILESVENFSLLKREAEGAGKVVSVSTADARARSFAQKAGLPVFAVALHGAPEEPVVTYFRPRMSDILPPTGVHVPPARPFERRLPEKEVKPVAAPMHTQQEEMPVPEISRVEILDAKPKKEVVETGIEFPKTEFSEKEPAPSWFSIGRIFGSWPALVAVGGGVSAVIVAYAFFLSPKAELIITPRTDTVSSTFTFSIAVNPGDNDIAGQVVEIQKEAFGEISASATADVEDKARGTVRIFNSYSSSPQTLVDTTRLVSQDGKLFRTTVTVVVPGATIDGGEVIASSIDVPVIASEAGPDYNIGPSTFSIPGFQGTSKYTKFFGKSSEAMTGGAKGTVKVVTADDIKKAEETASQDALAQAESEFSQKVPQDFILLKDARFLSQETLSNHEANDHADTVRATSRVRIRALLFKEGDIQAKIAQQLAEQFSADVEPIEGSVIYEYAVPSLDLDNGKMTISVKVSESVAWKVGVEEIRSQIAGKNEDEIKQIIEARSDVEHGTATFRPGWVTEAPEDPERIEVKVLLSPEM